MGLRSMFVALQRLMKWVPTIGYDASQRKSKFDDDGKVAIP